MRRHSLLLFLLFVTFFSFADTRLRNQIYVVDCTASMHGFNGSPDIWEYTKDYLKRAVETEIKTNPKSNITILPFQDKVLTPIQINSSNFNWSEIEKVLNSYIIKTTGTNICDSWLSAEKFINPSRDNYIYLLTDGQDNMGDSSNERLAGILSLFCNKYANTNGFYVELTKAAALPEKVSRVIELCSNLAIIRYGDQIPSFGAFSDNVIYINTRDLPEEISLNFSNSGQFKANLKMLENNFIDVTLVDDEINKGVIKLNVQPKEQYDNNITALNKIIGKDSVDIDLMIESEDLSIVNPDLLIRLMTFEPRTLHIEQQHKSKVERVIPFLWIKGNNQDTIRWELNPLFSSQAIKEGSSSKFGVRTFDLPVNAHILYDGSELSEDSLIIINPQNKGILEMILPATVPDGKTLLTLHHYNSNNLDRLNGLRPANTDISLIGEYTSSKSVVEIVFWCIIGFMFLGVILWFFWLKKQKYPTFSSGIITISHPYFATIKAAGYRKIVFSPTKTSQSFFSRIWKGKVQYHFRPEWPILVEITPAAKRNMKFNPADSTLVSSPSNLWSRGNTYDIINSKEGNKKIIEIQIN